MIMVTPPRMATLADRAAVLMTGNVLAAPADHSVVLSMVDKANQVHSRRGMLQMEDLLGPDQELGIPIAVRAPPTSVR